MRKTGLALLTAATLLLASCGGGGGSASEAEQKAADSISKAMLNESGSSIDIKKKDADCFGQKMVEGVGLEQLKKYGILTKNLQVNKNPGEVKLSTEDAEATTDALFACTDVQALMDNELRSQLAGQPAAVKKCVDQVLTDQRLRGMFVSIFSGDQQGAQEEIMQPMLKCAQKALGGGGG